MNMPKVRDSNGNFTKWLHPLSCSIHDSLQPLSTVSMVLPPEDEINNLDWVEVPVPDGSVMYCRVASLSTDAVTGQKSIYLEHGACLFDDILIPESSGVASLSWKTTISAILTNIINKQPQNQVFRWTAGTVQATDTIYIEPGGMSLMTAVMTMMESIPGYQVEFVQASANDWHIDIKQRPTTVSCEGRLSRNLRSCNVDYSTSGIVTRVYCEGINTAGYMDSSNKSTYGLHEETMSVNDGLTLAQRQSIVQAYLDAHDHPAVSISISALELSQLTGVTFDRFKKGTLCRIVIPWLGLTVNEVIVDKSYGDVYGSPEEVTISLANTAPDLSIAIANITGGGGGGGGGAKVKQNERFATKFEQTKEYFRLLATDSEWDAMGNSKINVYSQITQTASSIQSVVSRTGYTGSAFFDSSASYVVGDIVMYKGKMYRFNAAHQGDWTGSDVTQVTNLYSTVTQTEEAITTEIGRATEAEGVLSSRITQAADSVSMIVDSSTGAVTPAKLILAINGGTGSSATIKADKINLDGSVTANSIFVTEGGVKYLRYGNIQGTSITATNLYLENTGTGGGYYAYTPSNIHMNAISLSNPFQMAFLGRGDLDLTHAHTVTVDSTTGVATMGPPCKVSDAGNFNIADTAYFRNAVSAAVNSLSVTSGASLNEADVQASSNITGASASKTLTLSASNWTPSGVKTFGIYDGNTEVASIDLQNPGMGGEWTQATGSSAGISNIYRVREKDENGNFMGAATGHQMSVALHQGAQSNNKVPITIVANNPSGSGTIIVAKDEVTVSGGGGQTIDGFSVVSVADATSSTAVKLEVNVSALDAQGNVLKSGTIYPAVPVSVYKPTIQSTNFYRSDANGNRDNNGTYVTFGATATTAGGLGVPDTNPTLFSRYIGNFLDAAKNSVTIGLPTWENTGVNVGASNVATVTASNGKYRTIEIRHLVSDGNIYTRYGSNSVLATTLTASGWAAGDFENDTHTYNSGHQPELTVSVNIAGKSYSGTVKTKTLKVYRFDNSHVEVNFGGYEVGRYYIDSHD